MLKARRLNANKLDRRIEIWQVTETLSASGAAETTWAKLVETWAHVSYPVTGQDEMVMADRQVSVTRANFDIRWRSGIVAKMQVRYGGERYDILSITEDGRRNFLTLKTEKREIE